MDGLFQDRGLGRIEGIIDPLPFLAACDQPGIAEDFHVMGQRRLGQVQVFQEYTGTPFPLPQELYDTQALFIAQGFKNADRFPFVHHDASFHIEVYQSMVRV